MPVKYINLIQEALFQIIHLNLVVISLLFLKLIQ